MKKIVVRFAKVALLLLLWGFLLSSLSVDKDALKVDDLRCEYRIDPLGIDNVTPRLSWKLVDAKKTRGQKQTAYQVLVASSLEVLDKDKGDLWNSGKKAVSESVNNTYEGQALTSSQECYWKVRVWDADGKPTKWSEVARFSMGLLQATDWKGEWIYKADQNKSDHNWYRKTFTLSENASSAFVYVGSFGYHELYVNGEKVTDNVMNPVSSYMKKRIPYLTYDIADKLTTGDNVIAIWHAAGWARWTRIREYRNVPFVFKAQAEIVAGDEHLSLASDTSWKCKKSHSEYYGKWDILHFGGETIDDSKKEDDWNTVAYDDSQWADADVFDAAVENAKIVGDNVSFALNSQKSRSLRAEYSDIKAVLSAQMVEPQVRFEEVVPVAVEAKKDGTYRIDMGQNFTGQFQIKLHNGQEGDSVLFEISDQLGEISAWHQKSKYLYGASGEGVFANRFNVGAGRWITVSGLSYKPELADIKGWVITTNRKRVSAFESSSELLNQIYEVNLDTYIANTLDGILMDCPHRERRGWGEVTVAAMYGDALPNYESGAYMDQYTQYMRDAQYGDGKIRAVINEEDRQFLMWKANSPITVWETYKMMGDKRMLADNYVSMQKWMTWLYEHSDYETGGALKIGERGTREFPGLGDWCTPKGKFWDSSNSPDAAHFNNCIYAYMLDCAARIATALDKADDAKIFNDRLAVQRKATHAISYNEETGEYLGGQQVNQAFALFSGVTPDSEKEKVTSQLEDEVLYNFPYYDTGSSGQALYTRYFIEAGERMDLVYELLQDSRHPSYGYFIRQGANVWPERWSAVGNSRIHTCYTGIGGYFVKGFGGIRPDSDDLGMKNFIVKPAPVGDLTYANTSYQSMYGDVVVNWKRAETTANYHIEVPANCTAKVYLPAVSQEGVKEASGNTDGLTYVGTEKSDAVGNYVVYQVEAGVYDFVVDQLPTTSYPAPKYTGDNLAKIARMSASSMHIVTEKNPGCEAFNVNDDDVETRWQSKGVNDEWVEFAWVTPQTFDGVKIDEEGVAIQSHKVQYYEAGKWIDLAEATSCGKGKLHRFDAVTSTKCRVYISEASQASVISEIEILASK